MGKENNTHLKRVANLCSFFLWSKCARELKTAWVMVCQQFSCFFKIFFVDWYWSQAGIGIATGYSLVPNEWSHICPGLKSLLGNLSGCPFACTLRLSSVLQALTLVPSNELSRSWHRGSAQWALSLACSSSVQFLFCPFCASNDRAWLRSYTLWTLIDDCSVDFVLNNILYNDVKIELKISSKIWT